MPCGSPLGSHQAFTNCLGLAWSLRVWVRSPPAGHCGHCVHRPRAPENLSLESQVVLKAPGDRTRLRGPAQGFHLHPEGKPCAHPPEFSCGHLLQGSELPGHYFGGIQSSTGYQTQVSIPPVLSISVRVSSGLLLLHYGSPSLSQLLTWNWDPGGISQWGSREGSLHLPFSPVTPNTLTYKLWQGRSSFSPVAIHL